MELRFYVRGKTEGVYHRRVDHVTAFVLAGGKSTRMGQDKAFLMLGGQTLLERVLGVARRVASEVMIVGDPQKFAAFAATVEDVYQERGPLGGIQAALAATQSEWNLILAVDLPFIDGAFLLWLLEEARKCGAVVTLPQVEGRLQPLCAVYRKSFASAAQRALELARNKIDPLFALLPTRVIEEPEILEQGYSPEMFQNLNTPEEYRVARDG